MKKELCSETRQLVKIMTLYCFAATLSGIFINIFIWRQTNNFAPIVIYNFFLFVALGIIYLFSGYWLLHYSARSLVKLSFVNLTIFYALLIMLRERAIIWLVPLGLLKGIGEGLFWSGFNLHQYVHTRKSDRDYYFGVMTFWVSFASICGPLLGGLIVIVGNNLIKHSFIGYYVLFFLTAAVLCLAFQQAFKFPRFSKIQFKISDIKRVIVSNSNFKKVLGQQALLGLKDVSMITIISIFAFIILSNEFYLGLYSSIVGLCAAIFGFLAGKLLRSHNRIKLSFVSAVILSTGAIVFAISQNIGTLIIYGASVVLGAFLDISLGTVYLSVIDQDQRPWREKYAYFISRETVLGFGRITSYFLLWIFFTYFRQETVVKVWLVLAGLIIFGMWWLMKKTSMMSADVQ